MAKSNAGMKRAAARKENRAVREKINAMTNQQLKGFLGGFESETIDRFEKVIGQIRAEQREAEITALNSQIDALNARKAALEGAPK